MKNLVINQQLTIPAAELEVSFARSSGPGGQNVNKVETKVELRWNPSQSAVLDEIDRDWLLERLQPRLTASGDVLVISSKTRDQAKNRADALDKMTELIRSALERPKARKLTRPSRRAVERRLQGKKHRTKIKQSRKPPEHD